MRIPIFLRAAFTLIGIIVLAACSEDQVTHKKEGVFKPTALVVFGDSYSDNGNTYRSSHFTYPVSPPYWEGRFSNGSVWVEYLARHFGLNPVDPNQLSDFAYGQAQAKGIVTLTTTIGGQSSLFKIPDLAGEYQLFAASNPQLDSNALYIVFIGANDFCNHFTPDVSAQQLIFDVLKAQKKLVRRLQENYHAAHFVVVNARDLSASPIAMGLAQAWVTSHPETTTQEYLDQFGSFIKKYNHQLALWCRGFSGCELFDANVFDRRLLLSRQLILKACLKNNGDYVSSHVNPCLNPNRYFYYDRIHPTTSIHSLMAQAVAKQLSPMIKT